LVSTTTGVYCGTDLIYGLPAFLIGRQDGTEDSEKTAALPQPETKSADLRRQHRDSTVRAQTSSAAGVSRVFRRFSPAALVRLGPPGFEPACK
jgi:hypothetical protein